MVRHHRQVPAARILVGCPGDRPLGLGQRGGRPGRRTAPVRHRPVGRPAAGQHPAPAESAAGTRDGPDRCSAATVRVPARAGRRATECRTPADPASTAAGHPTGGRGPGGPTHRRGYGPVRRRRSRPGTARRPGRHRRRSHRGNRRPPGRRRGPAARGGDSTGSGDAGRRPRARAGTRRGRSARRGGAADPGTTRARAGSVAPVRVVGTGRRADPGHVVRAPGRRTAAGRVARTGRDRAGRGRDPGRAGRIRAGLGGPRSGPGDDPVAAPGSIVVRRAPPLGPGPLRPGAGWHRPVVRLRTVRAPGGSTVGDLVPARPAVRLVVPGPADVGAVGSGRREWRHLGASDGARATSWGRWLVLGPDVTRVTLAGELRLPFARRLDDPGWLGGIVPPVGVAATHPPNLSLRPGRRRWAAHVAPRAGARPLTVAPRWSARVRSLTAMSPRRKWSRWAPRRPAKSLVRAPDGCAWRVTARARSPPLRHPRQPKRYPIDPDIYPYAGIGLPTLPHPPSAARRPACAARTEPAVRPGRRWRPVAPAYAACGR